MHDGPFGKASLYTSFLVIITGKSNARPGDKNPKHEALFIYAPISGMATDTGLFLCVARLQFDLDHSC